MEKQKKSVVVRVIQIGFNVIAGVVALGLLAVVVVPIFERPLHRSGDANAQNTAYNLKNAISAYFTEYRKYPVPEIESSNPRMQSDHALMDILFGSEPARGNLNRRGIAFFTGKRAKPMGDGRYRNGVKLEEGDTGELWDLWGNYYRVAVDLDGDGQMENVDRRLEVEHLPESILVWSAGPDGDFDTWKDNVTTW